MQLISGAVSAAVEAARANLAERLLARFDGEGRAGGAAMGGRKRRVIVCPVPGCGKPGGGPKWGWFCGDHKDLSKAEKQKFRMQAREGKPGSKQSARRTSRRKRGRGGRAGAQRA